MRLQETLNEEGEGGSQADQYWRAARQHCCGTRLTAGLFEVRQRTSTESMSLDVSKNIDLDTIPEAEPEEPATPAPKEGEGIIEEP